MRILYLILLLFIGVNGQAQSDDMLEPADDNDLGSALGGWLDDEGGTISEAILLGESDETLNIEVRLEGFDDTKEYTVKGEILTRSKSKVRDIPLVKREVSSGQQSVDLGFNYQRSRNSSASAAFVSSAYIRITVTEKKESGGDWLGEITEGLDIDVDLGDGVSRIFHLKKEWRPGSAEGLKVEVTLTPIGAARNSRG